MTRKGLAGGTVHKMPADFHKALIQTPAARVVWEDITQLARNEWICWVTSGKKAQTRGIRIKEGLSKLKGGMRRPCCWAGCPIARTEQNCPHRSHISAVVCGGSAGHSPVPCATESVVEERRRRYAH